MIRTWLLLFLTWALLTSRIQVIQGIFMDDDFPVASWRVVWVSK